MNTRKHWGLTPAVLVGGLLVATAGPRPPDVPFRIRMIDGGASETAAVADINHDGRLDIVSGEHWYEAPGWTKHRFRDLDFTAQYIDDFSDLIVDVDGDGFPDVVSVSWFAKRIAWWHNSGHGSTRIATDPESSGGSNRSAKIRVDPWLWPYETIHAGFNVEFAVLADVDNDGKAREIVAQENGTGQAWYEVQKGRWVAHVISDTSYGHGIGVGDVNKDGRNDILTPRGWLESPADPRSPGWTFHPDWEAVNVTPPPSGGGAPKMTDLGFMHVTDVNGDGRNDVVAAAGHDYGVFWFEQGTAGTWTRHVIDDAWSQGHASTLVDLNQDGRPDLVTGKRFMAHNGRDPGEREPLGVYWYEHLPAQGGSVEWVRHIIDVGGRLGGGMQIPVVDIDGDGDQDLVCAGKSGLFLIENLTKGRPVKAAISGR